MMIVGVLLIIFLVYTLKGQGFLTASEIGKSGIKRDALDILRERYARGEIETEEFNLRRQELEKY